jgi:hypothetical protein
MNLKSFVRVKSLLLVGTIALAVSCTKKDTEATDVSSIANDDNSAENAFYDLKNVGDAAGTEASTKSLEKKWNDSCLTVSVISYDKTTKSGKVLLDFGTENCSCNDGKNRRGKIEVEYIGGNKLKGASVIYKTGLDGISSYYVNDYKVEGLKTVTYTDSLAFSIKVVGGKVTKPDGSSISWTSDRTRKMVDGYLTPFDFSDDVYEITGTSSGVNSSGNTYSFEVLSPLVKAIGCQYIKAGKLSIKRAGKKDATLDYGDGTCDDKGTMTVGSWTKEVTLRKW